MGMRQQQVYFDGVNLDDFGVLPITGNIYASPARKYDEITVPGRNGNLVIAQGGYENVTRSYDVICSGADVARKAAALRNFLASRTGYRRLEDTLHPDEFYLGCFRGGLESAIPENIRWVRYTLSFDCKPQRFLKEGETVKTFETSGKIVNPGFMDAAPLIRVYGSGTVTVNGVGVTLANNSSNYTDVDCDLQDAYRGSANRNGDLTLSGGNFPVLSPGENTLTLGAGITRVEIRPRWWRI